MSLENIGKFYTNYSFEYPNESLNVNVKNVSVSTSSFQDVPTNKNNLINLTMNGILRPSEKLHVIKMIFKGDIPVKNVLSQSYGTFVLCKDVYNARKIIKTIWDKETSTLTIIIDLQKYNVRPKRLAQFSFSIQINDNCKNLLNGITNCTVNYSGQDAYYFECFCNDNADTNIWSKEAYCDKNAVFFENNGALVTNGQPNNLARGSWKQTCQVRNKIVKTITTVNGEKEEKNFMKIACGDKAFTCKNAYSGDFRWTWKINTVSEESFYANSWSNAKGVLQKN